MARRYRGLPAVSQADKRPGIRIFGDLRPLRESVEKGAARAAGLAEKGPGGMSAHVYDGPTERVFFSIPTQVDIAAAKEVWEQALCAQVDPELFFPDKGKTPHDARRICAACP